MKIFIIFFFIFSAIHIGHCQSIEKFVNETIRVDAKNIPVDSTQFYFPKEMFPILEMKVIEGKNGVSKMTAEVIEGYYDTFTREWYSQHLYAMEEPLLFNRKTEEEIYRFTWLRTFDNPIAIRIQEYGNDYVLYWKVLNGAGGYDPGEIKIDNFRKISQAEWSRFKKLLKRADFWEMQTGRSIIGTDGSEWILEGVTPKEYRVVTVWSPDEGDFYRACEYLLFLSGLTLTEEEKY